MAEVLSQPLGKLADAGNARLVLISVLKEDLPV